MKRIVLSSILLTAAAGCAPEPVQMAAPFHYNGNYYMAGDNACARVTQVAKGRVMCTNTAGQNTGYRDAMSDQQLQMYRHNQLMAQQRRAQAAAEQAALMQQMQHASNSIQLSTPQYTPMPAPVVAPISMPGSNTISCISVSDGFYTNCRY
ncbi:hypothetical protein RUESEDTHA_01362 [Ruegeria sp. THAF57]|uniref:hypothetical protein n=1 Tax=Ruegeria sp. THAF57 TaxID=2744555 RepID=UPI0015E0530C|nr:hypothetical protein [Ruegeria sp. THAF57]CAD0184480.1 hypothetical protein RUESEDTHA_01362 [Ruegeria sp. THAF57]